jgi:hypothetical protein
VPLPFYHGRIGNVFRQAVEFDLHLKQSLAHWIARLVV